MNKNMIPSKDTLPEIKESYSPKETAAIRTAITQSVLSESLGLLKCSREKTDLYDTESVKVTTEIYMQHCIDNLMIPTFEGLCGAFGIGRSWFYEFLQKNPKSKTTEYLEAVRTVFADIKQQLAMRNVTNPVMTIFILKNSNLGYTDKTEIDMRASSAYDQYNTQDVNDIRDKYIENLSAEGNVLIDESEQTE